MTNKNNIILLTPPQRKNWIHEFLKYNSKPRHYFIPPRWRLTMPQIMNLERPCLSCILTDLECPDRKEDVVICAGDYIDVIHPFGRNEVINRTLLSTTAIAFATKNLKLSTDKAIKAFANLNRSFYNLNLGEPCEEKKI